MKKKILFGIFLFELCMIQFHFYRYYIFCSQCQSNLNIKCIQCSTEIIFKGLIIRSNEQTLNEIIKNNKSLSRIGTGEFRIIFGSGIPFQRYNKTLSKRLLDVLNNKEKNLLVGINLPYTKKMMEERTIGNQNLHNYFLKENKFRMAKIINKNTIYYSALISRFYSIYKDRRNLFQYVQKLKKIWDKRDVLIIEGDRTRIGIGNDLLNNAKSIKRILCPNVNAFRYYNKILRCSKKYGATRLILIALGPTASILAYDLSKLNYQAIDIGHMDIEYELFLRKANRKIKIPNKYFSEVKGGTKNISNVTDKNYFKQIVCKIFT